MSPDKTNKKRYRREELFISDMIALGTGRDLKGYTAVPSFYSSMWHLISVRPGYTNCASHEVQAVIKAQYLLQGNRIEYGRRKKYRQVYCQFL